MIIERQEDVTEAVLAAMAGASNPRLKEIMASLVRHLHAFAREVRLTEPEWEKAVEFVVGLGQRTNDTHNEVVLCSDAVGFSTLVCLLNNGNAGNTETAAALLGPFWRANSPRTANGGIHRALADARAGAVRQLPGPRRLGSRIGWGRG